MSAFGERFAEGGRRRLLVPAAVVAAGICVASAAWACTPGVRDEQTKISSCTVPSGSTKVCKPLLDTPAFPNATSVKGPAGSQIVAYTITGSQPNAPFDLMFANSTELSSGVPCFQATKIGGPSISESDGGIGQTVGTIPANAPIGRSEVCFADSASHTSGTHLGGVSTVPAFFKVTV